MSEFLRGLLNAKEPLFSSSLEQLSALTGNTEATNKLIKDIHTKSRAATEELGLNLSTVKGPELYQALQKKVEDNDQHLAHAIGGPNNYDVQALLPLIKKAVEAVDIPRDCWVLKKEIAEKMLRRLPPHNIMTQLNYQTIDELLTKENLFETYGALRFSEGSDWLDKFNQEYRDLTADDFETRQIEIVRLKDHWADLCQEFVHKKRHNITHLKELGVILMLPVKVKSIPGIAMTDMPLLLHYTNEIRLYSRYFQTQKYKKNFAEIFVATLIANDDLSPVMVNGYVHWRVIQRYLGKLENEDHPEIYEPHVQPEDLHWRKAEESLYLIDPELKFWQGMDYVGLNFDNRPVSFNLMDVSVGNSTQTPYQNRVIYHFRESLWNEIFARYMGWEVLENQILAQLDNNMVAPEKLVD